jgi:hydrophobe/amphiphile efflux-1 (HAE1) family protein
MSISKFFIDRPVFAWVIAIIIMLFGAVSVINLPITQYPKIAPPTVSIKANFPGASAETVENSVTQVIEQRLTGIDHLRYFTSSSESNGNANITITFEPEADADIAQVQVQNKLQLAMRSLPQEVQNQGVTVTKANDVELLTVAFYSEDDSISREDLGDILSTTVQDVISRVDGVGNLNIFGSPHAMRIWINPDKMLSFNLTIADIKASVQAQNIDVSPGQLGGSPSVNGQQINATITAQSMLKTVDDFKKIILKVNSDGSQVRLPDVARIEIGAQDYNRIVRYNKKVAIGMQVILASGANTIDVAKRVKAKMEEIKVLLPTKIKFAYPFDATPFVKLSIKEVIKTLIEAIVLVFIVMYLFLQNIRATLIPTIAVPVVLLGTFGVLAIFGYSINILTMFAMVLAIGLLVDDAIVVVENVQRLMDEEKLSPREATRKSMDQITSALIGIALVLSAVFLPMAFFGGSAGVIYRQFSITMVSAMLLSVFVALVLSPSLCATFLKGSKDGHGEKRTGVFGWFNKAFEWYRHIYTISATYVAKNAFSFILIYLVFISALFYLLIKMPTSFLPDEDQGVMRVNITAPQGSTMARTFESAKIMEDFFLGDDEKNTVSNMFTVVGFNGQNTGLGVVRMQDWEDRKSPNLTVFALKERAGKGLSKINDAKVFPSYPAAIRELGNASGFNMYLVDRGGLGHEELVKARILFEQLASQNKLLANVRPSGLEDAAQFKINIDNEKAMALGISLADVNQLLQSTWGPAYINDFIEDGRIKKVFMQADAEYRMLPEDLNKWYVRNKNQEMVPFSSFATTQWKYGSPKLERFNGFQALNINGEAAKGISSGVAMLEVEKLMKQMPPGIGIEWSGLSYEEKVSGAQAPVLYFLSMLVIFLSLAALYESWSIPFSILLIVPLGIAGAVLASTFNGLSNNVYFQVGLLTTIGLSAKNAIMIVEFAKKLHEEGGDLFDSTILAANVRFRPIIMTSIAFILGVTPLAIASGAGSASQQAIGIVVLGGMLGALFLDTLFIPMFFIIVTKISSRIFPPKAKEENNEK